MGKNFGVPLEFYHVVEGVVTSCRIPVVGYNGVNVEVRAQKECAVNAITEQGEVLPLVEGKIVRWSGKVTEYTAVEIVASSGFWYSCQRSAKWYEIPDPTPLKIELRQTENDIIRMMIDERLRAWKVKQELDRELTDEETEELILDIAHGDLEFDNARDEFGLGYEEAIASFTRAEQASQNDQRGGVAEGDGNAAPARAGSSVGAENPPAEGSNSSST